MRPYWNRVVCKSNTTGMLTMRQAWKDRDAQGVCHMTVKAEMGVKKLQGKECQGLPVATRTWRGKKGFSYRFQKEHVSEDTLISDFWPPEL